MEGRTCRRPGPCAAVRPVPSAGTRRPSSLPCLPHVLPRRKQYPKHRVPTKSVPAWVLKAFAKLAGAKG